MAIEHNIAETHLKSAQPKQAASVFTSSKYHKDSLVALEHMEQKYRIKQARDKKLV
jgi:DICT domain-containing protein